MPSLIVDQFTCPSHIPFQILQSNSLRPSDFFPSTTENWTNSKLAIPLTGQEPVNFLDNLKWDPGTVESQTLAPQHVPRTDAWFKAGCQPKLWSFRGQEPRRESLDKNGEDLMQIGADKREWSSTEWQREPLPYNLLILCKASLYCIQLGFMRFPRSLNINPVYIN